MEITRREIIASISIIAIMLLIGVLLSGKVSERQMDMNERYNKATKIENKDLFEHGMNTNIGDAFIYGELKAVDTVSYPDIDGEYLYLEKIKERYTQHTRTVTKTKTVNGKTQTYTDTETYYSWDEVDREEIKSKKITFLEKEFNSSQIQIPSADHIETIKDSFSIRHKYYGYPVTSKGTIFANLSNNNIGNDVPFYNNMTIPETVDSLESNAIIICFWIVWIAIIIGAVYLFYVLDNKWLN